MTVTEAKAKLKEAKDHLLAVRDILSEIAKGVDGVPVELTDHVDQHAVHLYRAGKHVHEITEAFESL